MVTARSSLLFMLGLILGILVSWALGSTYGSLLDLGRGSLAIRFVLAAAAAGMLMRKARFGWIGFGMLGGAALETAFFLWLLSTWSRGLESL